MKLLIVDDNATVRRLIRSILANCAHEIHECADGLEALAAYTAILPDFVLMDISIKGLDGIAATRQIRAAHPAAMVIVVTDYDEGPLRNAARIALRLRAERKFIRSGKGDGPMQTNSLSKRFETLVLVGGLALLSHAPALAQTTINVNSTAQVSATDCTLSNAIRSANTAAPVGSCTFTGSGAPYTIQLQNQAITIRARRRQ